MNTTAGPGERFVNAFFEVFDSASAIASRPLAISRLDRAGEATRVEREISELLEHDEREAWRPLQIYFRSTLRVTRDDGIVVKISQEIMMLVRRTARDMDDLRLVEMRTATFLIETYPEGDVIGEPMEEGEE
ncbi:hypothetical protein J3F83DRAFT_771376 [Trichoderma novae-zelandiae]